MISVIVPVYKVEPYLRQCVDSILNQTYRDLEVLLIDDGSPDKCGEVCDEYEKKDRRVRVFHTENRGLSAARNLGLKEARGEYIGFVDSDDWIEPDMYKTMLARLEETGAEICACGFWEEYGNTIIKTSLPDVCYENEEGVIALLEGRIRQFAWNKLYLKELFKRLLFPEFHVFEDVATIYRTFFDAEKTVSISNLLYHYRRHKDCISNDHSVNHLMDYWDSYYMRYREMKQLPAFNENRNTMGILVEKTVRAATIVWRWIYVIPKDNQKKFMTNLKSISKFVRKNTPILGFRNCGTYARVMMFLARYPNRLSFLAAYVIDQQNRRKREILIGL